MKNLSRQEKLIAALIGSVLLLICVIVAGGGALYISVNRLRAAESAELIPTASVGEAAVRSDIESEVELLSESEVPATNTPRPTLTVAPTETRLPPTFTAPAPQPTEPRTNTDVPNNPPAESGNSTLLGTYNNPVPIGTGYRFAGHGTMTVTEARWQPGQTGVAVVGLSFTCERPADQPCNTGDFMLDATGSAGVTYIREFGRAVPEPSFGDFMTDEVYGGGTQSGYAGFLITNDEDWLMMKVEIFLDIDRDPVFFQISR